MRGKAQKCKIRAQAPRITPACAGEKNAIELELIKRGGSPPHVRGKAVYKDIKRAAAGITPACAGKSIPGRSPLSTPGDHPRMCGEKATFRAAAKAAAGSPPHVRGKVNGRHTPLMIMRITPACAGKREFCRCRPGWRWDHPRMCGEKAVLFYADHPVEGSPPHVRGKAMVGAQLFYDLRITPACAGKRG